MQAINTRLTDRRCGVDILMPQPIVAAIELLEHTNRKAYVTYEMVPCLVTLTDL